MSALAEALRAVCRRVARRNVEEGECGAILTPETVPELLGPPPGV